LFVINALDDTSKVPSSQLPGLLEFRQQTLSALVQSSNLTMNLMSASRRPLECFSAQINGFQNNDWQQKLHSKQTEVSSWYSMHLNTWKIRWHGLV